MKGIFLLYTLSLTAAFDVDTSSFPQEAKDALCVLDDSGLDIVSDALDASLFLWAADKRCGTSANLTFGNHAKCQVDVWSAISATNAMVNVILKALDKCDAIHTIFAEKDVPCGRSIGVLTKHATALVAEGFEAKDKCGVTTWSKVDGETAQAPLMCVLDLKDMAKHLYHGVKRILKIKAECMSGGSKRKCVVHSLDVLASVAGFGSYISGAIGNCERTSHWFKNTLQQTQIATRPQICGKAALGVVHHTARLSSAILAMTKECGIEEKIGHPLGQRLYGELDEQDDKKTSNLSSIILGAFLPVSAIAGFVGGRFYRNRRGGYQEARSWMSDDE